MYDGLHVCSSRYFWQILTDLEFSQQIFEKRSNFIKIRPVRAELFRADERTEGQTWRRQSSLFAILRTLQMYTKFSMYIFLNVFKLWRNMLPEFYTQKKEAVDSFETFINFHKTAWHSAHNTILFLFSFHIAVLSYNELYRSTEATNKRFHITILNGL